MDIKFFNLKSIASRSDIRKQFLKLAKTYHPDCGGSNEDMKQVNKEFDFLDKNWAQFVNDVNNEDNNKPFINLEKFQKALNPIIALKGINIEICGSWIWVTGMTYPHADIFRKAGYLWSKTKKAWFYNGQDKKHVFRKPMSLGNIRQLHGSVKVDLEDRKMIGGGV